MTGGDTCDFVTGPQGIGGPGRFENTQKRENMRTKIRGCRLLRGPLGPPWDPRGPRAYRKATHGPLWALIWPQWVPREPFQVSKGPLQTSKGPFGCPRGCHGPQKGSLVGPLEEFRGPLWAYRGPPTSPHGPPWPLKGPLKTLKGPLLRSKGPHYDTHMIGCPTSNSQLNRR